MAYVAELLKHAIVPLHVETNKLDKTYISQILKNVIRLKHCINLPGNSANKIYGKVI